MSGVENYFNYFTEIEEHFQRRRGTALPVWIGLPGIVDYSKLVRISMKSVRCSSPANTQKPKPSPTGT